MSTSKQQIAIVLPMYNALCLFNQNNTLIPSKQDLQNYNAGCSSLQLTIEGSLAAGTALRGGDCDFTVRKQGLYTVTRLALACFLSPICVPFLTQ